MNVAKLLGRWSPEKLVRAACYVGIVALLLMAWSVLDPTVIPVLLGMGAGQGLGVVAFGLFLLAVLSDVYGQASSEAEPRADTDPGANAELDDH